MGSIWVFLSSFSCYVGDDPGCGRGTVLISGLDLRKVLTVFCQQGDWVISTLVDWWRGCQGHGNRL